VIGLFHTLLAGKSVHVLGVAVGEAVGLAVGEAVGLAVGEAVGLAVGDAVGLAVGEADGRGVAVGFGWCVGWGLVFPDPTTVAWPESRIDATIAMVDSAAGIRRTGPPGSAMAGRHPVRRPDLCQGPEP
jgi:hypothetical protein